jgi:amino acid adenylation domain-containing protein
MTDIAKLLTSLSSEKRKLLEVQLLNEGDKFNVFPLSFAQQRLWFLDQLDPGSPVYNIPAGIRLEGKLNRLALEKSINVIIKRHEILRTRFITINNTPMQWIDENLAAPLNGIDLTASPEIEHEKQILKHIELESQAKFDLSTGPLIRISLIKVAEEAHILFMVMHHIISDGWSIRLFILELSQLYSAYCGGRVPQLSDISIQYADFAKWQRNWLQGENREKQLAYWKEKLSNKTPILELPTDRPRPAIPTNQGSTIKRTFPVSLLNSLVNLSRQNGATMYMTLLTAFKILLYRYSGQSDIFIGTPIANRNREETEKIIGFFVNTLVLRTQITGEMSFVELLEQVRETTLGAFSHQDLPFETLVEELQPERSMSYNPIFQVMFVYQKTAEEKLSLPGLTLLPIDIENRNAKFDLTLSVEEIPDKGLTVAIEFDIDLFDLTTIERLLTHFQVLLESISLNPEESLLRLSLMPDEEKNNVLSQWNASQIPLPENPVFPALFEQQCRTSPESIALVAGDHYLSYDELNRRSNLVASYLNQVGIGPENFVGILIERSIELLVAIVGVLKSGAAYVPLDPTYPQERVSFIIKQADISVLLTQKELSKDLKSTEKISLDKNTTVLCIDSDWEMIAQANEKYFNSKICPQNPAYVIFTSGSTGRPKGVIVAHQSMIHLYFALNEIIYSRYPGNIFRSSLNAPVMFDASVQQIVLLLGGHALNVLPSDIRGSGDALFEFLQDKKLEVLDCVPSQLKLLLESGFLQDEAWQPRICLPGGEAIDTATWKELVGSEKIDFFNMYGPTECAVDSTICYINDYPTKPVIGSPVVNMKCYVLDQKLQLVPIGVIGEIYLGGLGVARGYVNRPDLTAERFIPDPFEKGECLYRTGDLGRWLENGQLEYIGRADFQLKVRGFRIELGEVETVLRRQPLVKEVVVSVQENLPGGPGMIAYVVCEKGSAQPSAGELRESLKKELPEYMIPQIFTFLDKLPLTPNGKIDRKSLPLPEVTQESMGIEYVPPTNPTEEIVANSMTKLFNMPQVGIKDNFFDLGGHSLLATRFISQIRDLFKVEIALRLLFEYPTVQSISRQIDLILQRGEIQEEPPITPVKDRSSLPLSYAQQRLWFLDQFEPENAVYNIPSVFRINGEINYQYLVESVKRITERHETLRSYIFTEEGKPVQKISERISTNIPLIDLSELPPNIKQEQVYQLTQEEATSPFYLNSAPLFRIRLLRLGSSEHVLILNMHHIISDGWSIEVFIREVVTSLLAERMVAGSSY